MPSDVHVGRELADPKWDRFVEATPGGTLNKQVLSELEEIISIALEKDRKLRYQKAADIRADLQRLRQQTADHMSSPSGAASRTSWRLKRMARKRWRLAATALVAVAIVAMGLHFYPRRAAALNAKDTIVLADFANPHQRPCVRRYPASGFGGAT